MDIFASELARYLPAFAIHNISNHKMRLSDLQTGQTAIIVKVLGHGAFRKRIMEMGFVSGQPVRVVLDAPLKDPVKYEVMGYEVSLRRSEAAMVEVLSDERAQALMKEERKRGSVSYTDVQHYVDSSKRRISIALVGNPNSGKTSFFNHASGSHQHVGNYSGVTVDSKRATFTHKGYKIDLFDLPGTYALSAYSPEEVFVRKHLVDHTPDVVVNVVAASNLERNLYLTTELIDMDCTMVMALNMYDELEHSGAALDYDLLGTMLGMPIVPTVSRSGKGIGDLFDKVIDVYENREPKLRHTHITYTPVIESAIEAMENAIKAGGCNSEHFSTRYLALKMLERDAEIEKMLSSHPSYPDCEKVRDQQRAILERELGEDIESAVTNDKYGFISGALRETYKPGAREEVRTTEIIDSIVTNKLFGFPIFILLMWLMFETTFSLGAYPMEWIESGVAALGDWLGRVMSDGMLKDLLIDGVIGGVGGVIVFLPNILILYLFISFMEDSGYMARAAFIMDKLMHRMGLHGKSFIPLIMGFGCNVPAIMASRTIESRSSRLITILVNPFMSCSARLPVYVLLVSAFFPKHGSLVMISLYVTGIVVAVITSKLLRRFMFREDDTPFVMELPPYRIPTARSTVRHMWDKAAQYLRKMGGIILVASIVVWFLSYFPRNEAPDPALAQATGIEQPTSETAEWGEEADGEIYTYAAYMQQKNSYIGRMGQFITPVMEPIGFNWKLSVSVLSGAAAKEIVVSTLGVLYTNTGDESPMPLTERLKMPDPETGKPDLDPLTALSFLIFTLLYFPCLAALVAISKEAGSWKWGAFSFVYNTVVAWIVAFLVYNIGSLFV